MVGAITTRRLIYWLAAMVVLLIVGTSIGLMWADTSNVAGAFAGGTNIISAVGIVLILIALAVMRRGRYGSSDSEARGRGHCCIQIP